MFCATNNSIWAEGGWIEALLVQEEFILLSRPYLAGLEAPLATVEFDRGWVLDRDPETGVTHAVLMLGGESDERGIV